MEEEKMVYFTSTYEAGKEEHKDYNSVIYGYNAKMLPILTGISILFCFILPLMDSFDLQSFLISGFFYLCSGYLHLLVYLSIKNGYKRSVVANGKENVRYTVQFTDNISLSSEFHKPMEYEYTQIKVIKQTKLFYMLGLGHNLHIIVPKDIVSQHKDLAFIPFVMEKCTNLKKRKVLDYSHAEKISFVSVCVNAALVVINLLMMLIS